LGLTDIQPQPTSENKPVETAQAQTGAVTDLGDEAGEEIKPTGTEEKKADEPPAWAIYHGAPGEGADYEPLTAPDGVILDTDLVDYAKPIARELNLSQAGAQKLVDLKIKDNELQAKRWGDHLTELKTQAKADPEIGGAQYENSIRLAKTAMKTFGDPELAKMMNQYGVGAHPAMIRLLARVGKATGETSAVGKGEPGPSGDSLSLSSALYGGSK